MHNSFLFLFLRKLMTFWVEVWLKKMKMLCYKNLRKWHRLYDTFIGTSYCLQNSVSSFRLIQSTHIDQLKINKPRNYCSFLSINYLLSMSWSKNHKAGKSTIININTKKHKILGKIQLSCLPSAFRGIYAYFCGCTLKVVTLSYVLVYLLLMKTKNMSWNCRGSSWYTL